MYQTFKSIQKIISKPIVPELFTNRTNLKTKYTYYVILMSKMFDNKIYILRK